MSLVKKVLLGIVALVVLTIVGVGVFWFKGYYDTRYKVDDYYYAVVPLDYVPDIVQAKDSEGKEVGIVQATYHLTGYNADGKEQTLEFTAASDMHDFYPPGTYIKVALSKSFATDKNAIPESEVPAKAMTKIKETFTPSTATTLEAYAAERTEQLASRSTPSLTITCTVKDNSLVYTYVYANSEKGIATESAELLAPLYKSQFRTDKDVIPALSEIYLEIRLEDGTAIFSQKYNTKVQFGYETQGN